MFSEKKEKIISKSFPCLSYLSALDKSPSPAHKYTRGLGACIRRIRRRWEKKRKKR
jgi:hypothetical protein